MSDEFIVKLEELTMKHQDCRIRKVIIMYALMMLNINKCQLLNQFVMALKGFMTAIFCQLIYCFVNNEKEDFFEGAMKLYNEIMLFNEISAVEAKKIKEYCLAQIEIKDDSLENILCGYFNEKSFNPVAEGEDKIDFFYIQAIIFKIFTDSDEEDFIFKLSSVPKKSEIEKKIIEIYQENGYSHAGGKKEKLFFSKEKKITVVALLVGNEKIRIKVKKY